MDPLRIAGIVVDAAGRPVARATVSLFEPATDFDASTLISRGNVATDLHGRFEIALSVPGEYDLLVEPPNALGRRRRNRHRVRAGDIDLRLALPVGAITGRALLDRAPVPHFGVLVDGHRIELRSQDGRFSLPYVDAKTCTVAVLAPGARIKLLEAVVVEAGQTVALGDIVLERGQRITGRVRDPSGTPAADACVSVGRCMQAGHMFQTRLDLALSGMYETDTDRDGAYAFDGIDAHRFPRSPHIWATHASGASLIRELGPEDHAIDFDILATGAFRGVVDGVRGGHPSVCAVRRDEPPGARRALVDRNGLFVFENLPVGDYEIRVEPDYAAPVHVTIVEDRFPRIELVMTDPSVRLCLWLPLRQAMKLKIEPITAGAGVDGKARTVLRKSGRDECSLTFVRAGDYRVSLDGEHWRTITVAPEPEEQTIDLLDI